MADKTYKILCEIENHLRRQSGGGQSNIASSLSAIRNIGEIPQQIARSNPRRTALWICNDSIEKFYLAPFGGEVSRDLFSVVLAPGETLILNAHNFAHLYKDNIYGFWEASAGEEIARAMITEFYISK